MGGPAALNANVIRGLACRNLRVPGPTIEPLAGSLMELLGLFYGGLSPGTQGVFGRFRQLHTSQGAEPAATRLGVAIAPWSHALYIACI